MAALIGCATEESERDGDYGEFEHDIRGTATVASVGQFEAVVKVGGCSGTLITKEAVLTAGHCVCTSTFPGPNTCNSTATVTFDNVLPVGSSTRQNVTVTADVIVHPEYNTTAWLTNDYAILRLHTPADQLVQVSPIQVSSAVPSVGTVHTMVGYGGYGTSCANAGNGVKRYGSTALDSVLTYASPGGKTLVYNDTNIGSCPGDSGGPVIYSGEVVGVASSGDTSTNSNYDATGVAYSWLRANACPVFDKSYPGTNFCDDPLCPCVSGEGDCDQNWQCGSGRTCVQDIGAASNLPATEDLCWDNAQLVTFYTGSNYTGTSYKLPVGKWDYATLAPNIGNDTISSLKAPPGLWVQLWSESNCWYNHGEYYGDVASLGAMDNQTSCLEIKPGVSIYPNQNFSGTYQTLPPGAYNHTQFPVVGNDNIESLVAAPGILVRVCSESGASYGNVGWGTCQELSGSVASLGSLNNSVSNIEVFAGVTVYRDADYGGVSQTFREGTYGAADLSIVGNDQISSLIVAPGMKATLCSENGGWGDCKEYTGLNSFVGKASSGATMNDRTSYISVTPL